MRETLDIDTIFRSTTEELRGVMKCDRVVVFQFDSNWSGQFVAESVGNGWISLIQQQTNNPQANEKLVNDPHCAVRATMLRGTSVSITDSYLQQTKGGAYNQNTSYRVTQDIYPEDFHLPSLLTSLSEIFQMKATQKSITFTYLSVNQLPKLIHIVLSLPGYWNSLLILNMKKLPTSLTLIYHKDGCCWLIFPKIYH
jgi:hypothetical protein